jgi:hypothetical protein
VSGPLIAVYDAFPTNDLIEHERSDECVCGPRLRLVETDDGDAWVVVHQALDGRE